MSTPSALLAPEGSYSCGSAYDLMLQSRRKAPKLDVGGRGARSSDVKRRSHPKALQTGMAAPPAKGHPSMCPVCLVCKENSEGNHHQRTRSRRHAHCLIVLIFELVVPIVGSVRRSRCWRRCRSRLCVERG